MIQDLGFVVVGRCQRTPTIVEIELAPLGQVLDFRAGQYVLVSDDHARVAERSYSVANAPRVDGHLTLLVTRVAGGETSGWMHDRLGVGDGVRVSGPFGTFVSSGSRPVLALAAGSGLAPVRALAEQSVQQLGPRPFTVVFSARCPSQVMDADLFRRWGRLNPGLWFVPVLTRTADRRPMPRVPVLLPSLVRRLDEHEVYIAGAPGFVSGCLAAVRRHGAHPARVHVEEFFVEPQPWTSAPEDDLVTVAAR